MFSAYFKTIDGWDESISYETKEELYAFMYRYLGTTFSVGSSYAVNMFGDLTVTLEEGDINFEEYRNYALERKHTS